MAVGRVVALVVGAVLGACVPNRPARQPWPDAPIALRDDTDRDQAIDRLWVMAPGAERDHVRAAIAAAIARRIADAIEEDRQPVAAALLDQLTWMWHQDPSTVGLGLAPHAELLHRLRGVFAKAGTLEPVVQLLVLLAEVEPARRTQHLAELDQVLAFADELAIADNGANASRAQPIALLQPTALALPLPWLVDRYVSLLEARQLAVSSLIDHQGASIQLVRAHHDILATARRIANVLARAGRVPEIHRHLARMKGLGTDKELSVRAEIVADQGTADSYSELASLLRVDERAADAAAALATDLAGLAKFPGDTTLIAAAAGDAHALGRTDQAIQLYESALHGSRELDAPSVLRLGSLYGERIARLAEGGRPRAANEAWRGVLEFMSKSAKQHPHTVWQQAAAIAESALGRGLASQGLITDAKHALTASLERAPSIDAYETLATIEVQLAHFKAARQWAATGLAMLGEQSSSDRYRRAKLERIGADGLRRAGRPREAAARYLESLRAWASLGELRDLPRAVAAERLLDTGRAKWWSGEQGLAVEDVMGAVDLDPDAPAIVAGAVAFLLEVGRSRDAVDAYHRGLSSPAISDFYKVYMSLWLAGDAKRLGEPLDRLAADYLGSRHGDTWHELLARAATGRLSFEVLRAAATTGPRQAELAFYGAVLGIDPRAATPAGREALLGQVVAARTVLDAEYDLARVYLSLP